MTSGTPSDDPPRLRVAIVGGGIAGATLWLALKDVAGVELTVYDGARELRCVPRSSPVSLVEGPVALHSC